MNAPEKVGTHRALVESRTEKRFKKGSLMFIEGETSTEMYIIRSGKVRILKQEGESSLELAILGPGSVLGELSLLDHQPRSATAQVVEDLSATAIDEKAFEQTIQNCPSWLSNMIRVVVKRLRDTMKRTSGDLVRKNVAGVIKVLILLYNNEKAAHKTEKHLLLNKAKETIFHVIGLGGVEAESVFLHLIFKSLMCIRRNDMGQEYVIIKDPVVMQMYMNFLRARQRSEQLPGEQLSDKAVELIGILRTIAEKCGKKIKETIWQVGLPQLELELERQGKGRHIDPDVLDELRASKIVLVQEDAQEVRQGRHTRTTLIYNTEAIDRFLVFKQWLPTFAEEIQF